MGGEFNNDAVRQMGEAIGCKMKTGAGYSAWMNGLNQRNHAVVDRCLAKILHDDLKIDPKVAIAWAVTSKNSYPARGGFSSFQLVFGKQPKLPNAMEDKLPALEAVMTSKSLVTCITAMQAGRKAFTEALYDQKVWKALRCNVRAVERVYVKEEEVFYRRDSNRVSWRGPAIMLGSRCSVYFLVHQGDVLRVAACRIVSTGDIDRSASRTRRPPRYPPTVSRIRR